MWGGVLQASRPVEFFFNYFAGVLVMVTRHRDRQDKFIFLKSFAWAVVPAGPKRVQGRKRPFRAGSGPSFLSGGRAGAVALMRLNVVIV